MGRYFGTDGVRGVANDELTPELAYKIGRAAGYLLKDAENKLVLIGKDTRQSGDMLESALASGFQSCGLDTLCLGVIPTPAVAHLTREFKGCCGVVISASHNPGEYNGIKLFSATGYKLPDEVEEEIEDWIDRIDEIAYRPTKEAIGNNDHHEDGGEMYVDFLKSRISTSLKGVKIAVDCGHGATYHLAERLFTSLGAEVVVVNTEPDGMNINLNCGSTNAEVVRQLVLETQSDLGVSFDGDGDRVIAVDELGEVMDGDHILAACATLMKRENKLPNNMVVGTVMTNIGLIRYLETIGVDLIMANVGDRYVLEEMVAGSYVLGGEQSGHVIFIDDNTTGDGMMTALKLAEAMVVSGKKMSELNQLMVTYPQILINAKVSNGKKHDYIDDPVIQEAISALEERFHGEGRVLIRPSGTEPLVRVMIEGKNQEELEVEARALADLVESRLNV